jgi:hypothetical protein
MALPTQEIERLTRGKSAEQGSYKQLLLLAGSLFSISLIIYLGLSYGYEPYLNSQKDDLDAQIQESSKKIPEEDQARLVSFYSQLANVKTLLEKHPMPSKAFDWLERNTQTNTYFTKFTFNVPTSQLTLLGNSRSPEDAAEQAAIFESQPEVSRLNLNNLAVSPGGGWQFNMTISMDSKFLLSTAGAASTGAGISPAINTVPVAPSPSTSTTAGNATTTP